MATPHPHAPKIKPLEWPKPLTEEEIASFDDFTVLEGIEESLFGARYLLDRLTAETL